MRKLALFLLLITAGIVASSANQFSVQIFTKGYNGTAELNILGENFSKVETVKNGSVLSLPPGNYTLKLFALNKTFVEDLKLDGNKTITFNLLFTNKTENLSVIRHVIIQPNLEVLEIILITNSGEANFEGDIAIPLPQHSGLEITDSSLSFLDLLKVDGKLILEKIIVPANSTGDVSITYKLTKPFFSLATKNQTILVLTTLPVVNQSNVSYLGVKQFSGEDYSVYRCESDCTLEFKAEPEIRVDKTSAVLIIAASGLLFLYFFTKRGGWE
ncbi:hypothetical protein [Archaeoglobus sp.]